ncbi:hypothetical protein L211DRAFT_852371 [Terfezia boudieri ATCC MYA-4762]|uniref:Uncharacterized protein n=1 Tax=Terfezia boudieri ATCC MYA-4762 TaxID=1051890 RepID=A0A3N4LC08_9PEZI|nr:hypothetical protein L211DRAFT_852371 [Terfezia boudieri ATCC MYA-4762]
MDIKIKTSQRAMVMETAVPPSSSIHLHSHTGSEVRTAVFQSSTAILGPGGWVQGGTDITLGKKSYSGLARRQLAFFFANERKHFVRMKWGLVSYENVKRSSSADPTRDTSAPTTSYTSVASSA